MDHHGAERFPRIPIGIPENMDISQCTFRPASDIFSGDICRLPVAHANSVESIIFSCHSLK